jgi:hypothetical protein
VPQNAPTGPAAQGGNAGRGGYAQGGGYNRGGGHGYQRGGPQQSGGAGYQGGGQSQEPRATDSRSNAAPSNASNNVPQKPLAGPPSLFKPPAGDYIDQQNIGAVGAGPKWTHCLRCGKLKGLSHPAFRDCADDCGFCYTSEHQGEPCRLIYCSEKWWGEHLGHIPTNVQRRPSEVQRERLEVLDLFFRNFPQAILPQSKGALKRVFDDTLDEVEAAKYKAAEEVLRRQRDLAKREVLEARRKQLDAERSSMDAESVAMEYKESAEKWKKQAEQFRQFKEERDQKLRGFDQEISSREKAMARREKAKYQSLLEQLQKEWQAETEKRVQEAVQQARAEILADIVAIEAASLANKEMEVADLAAKAIPHSLAADQVDQLLGGADLQGAQDEAERQKPMDESAAERTLALETEEEKVDLIYDEDVEGEE